MQPNNFKFNCDENLLIQPPPRDSNDTYTKYKIILSHIKDYFIEYLNIIAKHCINAEILFTPVQRVNMTYKNHQPHLIQRTQTCLLCWYRK